MDQLHRFFIGIAVLVTSALSAATLAALGNRGAGDDPHPPGGREPRKIENKGAEGRL